MNRKSGKTKISTPPKFAAAVTHVTSNFHATDRVYGGLTSFFCRSKLHPIPLDDHFAISMQDFAKLKESTGVTATERLLETIAQKTPPAFIKGYFLFYLECAVTHAVDCYRELLEVARANQRSLGEDADAWAISCMRTMIKNSRFYAESWLQSVCENRTYRPALQKGDVLMIVDWRPPALCFMSPLGPFPFDEKVAWDRANEQVGLTVMTFAADNYETNVLARVEQFARTEEFSALKMDDVIDVPPTGTASTEETKGSSTKFHLGREVRRAKTQAVRKVWQKEYRKLKKQYPGMSDVRISVQIAKSVGKPPGTVARYMKNVGGK